jgi:two-component system, chemotaxis family, protein-glutamate methylesterase/glutaminase
MIDTSGLWSIKRLGGIAVVQQPDDPRFESMPKSALEYVEVDYSVPASEIGPLLTRLASEQPAQDAAPDPDIQTQMAKEIEIAPEDGAFRRALWSLERSRHSPVRSAMACS